jgi:hypothetical protein
MHCVDFNLIVIQVKALFLKHGGVMNTTWNDVHIQR